VHEMLVVLSDSCNELLCGVSRFRPWLDSRGDGEVRKSGGVVGLSVVVFGMYGENRFDLELSCIGANTYRRSLRCVVLATNDFSHISFEGISRSVPLCVPAFGPTSRVDIVLRYHSYRCGVRKVVNAVDHLMVIVIQ
jgi:hypothetical protein